MKKTGLTIAAALAGALLGSPALAQKTVLTVGMQSTDAGVLDPHLNSGTPGKAMLQWMFNGLVRIKPGELSPEFMEPDLAESWTSSTDSKEWTFKLRQGVQCHHGYGEFTSEDAVYSLARAASKETSAFSSDYAAFDKVEAPDKYTVKITLKQAIPSLLGIVMNYHGGNMVCKKAAEELGKEGFAKKPVGTGPFMFQEYVPQQYAKLVANPNYFRGKPKLTEILYRFIPSDSSRDLAFQSGEIDMMLGRQEQAWVDRMNALPGVKVVAMGPAEMSMLHLNMSQPPLDNLKVRQAIAYAVDRNAIWQFRGKNISRPAVSVVPSGYLGTDEKAPLYPFDLAKSKALLAEAGFPNGVTIKAINTTLPSMLSFTEATQALLKRAGITLEIQPVEHATFHQQIRQDLSQVVHFQAARFPIADVYLSQFFHSRAIVKTPTAVTNFSHCKVADAEIDAARSETDKAKQLALWKTAQEKIIKEVCAIPVNEMMQLWAYKDSLDLGYDLKASLNLGPPVLETTRFTK
ncbi:ABC transporter substrate-binding protein [Bosea vaviloviae]|uniref:Polyamine ABC transporter substrate-binding protein n=1 Tax=Bosea vaviloviae TaxID=1526658 RepID=A0A1D7TYH0_9HYPH|nr:ABC transporter substrate-binding protein [Bosea vaviloviae]AOO80171.1 polyamine ABC transporter substrate-binding protein [Bosea vaviloviae]